ncbi:MAG: GC-type dockerin domain-anchored protein [Phycisphaerales bacterium]
MTSRRSAVALLLAAAALTPAALAQTPAFHRVDPLAGGVSTQALRIADDGSVVCGVSDSPGGELAIRWTIATGTVSLGVLPDRTGSLASGISADGSVIVGESFPDGRAFRWTSAGMVDLGKPDDSTQSAARNISPDGSTVVGLVAQLPDEFFRAAIWTAEGGWTVLGVFDDGPESNCTAASTDGSIVVGISDSNLGGRSFRYTRSDGAFINIGLSGPLNTAFAADVSANGKYIAGFGGTGGALAAFRYGFDEEGSTFDFLPHLPDRTDLVAHGISPNGAVIVGGAGQSNLPEIAFIWTPDSGTVNIEHVLTTHGVSLGGLTLSTGWDVAADGRTVAGLGRDEEGNNIGWVAVLPAALVPCNSADVAGLGSSPGWDGALTVDDIVFYLSRFFGGDLAVADIASLGGEPVSDGQITVDDLVRFLSQFFSGCQ